MDWKNTEKAKIEEGKRTESAREIGREKQKGEKELPEDVKKEIKREIISYIKEEREKKEKEEGQIIFVEELPWWTRVAVVEDGKVYEFLIDIPTKEGDDFSSGNIYKGIIADVIPSLQAVFINIGAEKNAYLFVPSQSKIANYKPGETIIVQIKKESIDSKGAKITDNPTLPGKYLVLTLEKKIGISRKIKSKFEKARLKRIISKLFKESGEQFGVVARTEAQGVSEELIKDEFEKLLKTFQEIKEKAEKEPAPALLWSDRNIIRKAVRDYVSSNLKKVVSNSQNAIEKVKEFIKEFTPNLLEVVSFELSKTPFVFREYGIEEEFEKALQDKIEIEGGIELVFNETEAFTAIDVNTASFTGTENLDITAYQANLIAAREIIRQMRLRKLGGIIIIDFIDIKSKQLKQNLLKEVKRLAEKDKEKTKVFGITRLGLVEISRKKQGYSLKKMLMSTCPTCQNGFVESDILKLSEIMYQISKYEGRIVKVSPETFKIIDENVKKLNMNVRIQPKYGLGKWQIEV